MVRSPSKTQFIQASVLMIIMLLGLACASEGERVRTQPAGRSMPLDPASGGKNGAELEEAFLGTIDNVKGFGEGNSFVVTGLVKYNGLDYDFRTTVDISHIDITPFSSAVVTNDNHLVKMAFLCLDYDDNSSDEKNPLAVTKCHVLLMQALVTRDEKALNQIGAILRYRGDDAQHLTATEQNIVSFDINKGVLEENEIWEHLTMLADSELIK